MVSTKVGLPSPESGRADNPRSERRIGRPKRPARADVIGLLVSCLLVVVAFFPIIFMGRTLSTAGKGAVGVNGTSPFVGQPKADYSADFRTDPGASTWALEPWAEVNHRTYSQGELPFWNPYQGAGSPQMANMQSAPFDPLLLAVNLHPTPRTWDYSIVGAFILGAAAMFILGRVLGLDVLPSVVASAAFSLNGYFFIASNNHFTRSYIYLPILFLLVELVLRSRRLLPVFGLGLAVACDFLIGMPEISLFVIGTAGVYALVRIVQSRRQTALGISLARVGGGFALGAMLAAPVLLSFQQYEGLSFNVHRAGGGTGSIGEHSAWFMLNWIVPFFHGIRGPYNAPGVSAWVGVAAVVAALAAFCGRREARRRHAGLYGGIALVLLLKLYNLPPTNLLGKLPLLQQANFTAFTPCVICFAIAVLAGTGVQVILKRDLRIRRFLVLLALFLVAVVLVAGTGEGWTYFSMPSGTYMVKVWGRAALFGAIVVAAALLSRRVNSRLMALFAAAAVIAELLTLAPFSMYALRADPYARPQWMNFVNQVLEREPDARVFGADARLFPDTASAFGLQDIRVLDAVYVDRYWRYIKTFVQPLIKDRFVGGPPASADETRVALYQNNPMFDALAVRVFLSQGDLPEGAAPGTSDGEHVSLRPVGQDLDTHVYENVNAYPRSWIVRDVHSVTDEDAAFSYLGRQGNKENGATIVDNFDPRHQAVVEQPDSSDQSLASVKNSPSTCDESRDQVKIANYSSDKVTLDVDAVCPGLLVLPDTYFPGWSATVNGSDQRIYPTDGAFRGVVVPAGKSTVEMTYRPTRFTAGLVLAVVGLLGFLTIALTVGWRRRVREGRRRSVQPPRGEGQRVVQP
jgi:hypothetical protein